MHNRITKLLLSDFNDTIIELNDALIEHFKLENKFTAPIQGSKNGSVPSKGTINHNGDSIEFRFHGTGCEFKINGLVLDFDYIFEPSEFNISFGPHEFKKFVKSLIANSAFLTDDEEDISSMISAVTYTENLSFKM